MAIASAGEVSVGWIAAGEGKLNGVHESPSLLRGNAVDEGDLTFVPVYGDVLSAGPGSDGGNARIVGHTAFMTDWLRGVARIQPQMAFVAEVRGESMLTLLEDGDLVLGEMTKSIDRQGIYAVRYGEAVLVKHVSISRRTVSLMSENKIYPDIELENPTPDEFAPIGRVVRKVVRLSM